MGDIIWASVYFIKMQNTRSEIIGFTERHCEATQEHSALFLQKCNTPLNRIHASCSVMTSDFFSWFRNVLHILLRFSGYKHLNLRSASLNLKISNWGILTILEIFEVRYDSEILPVRFTFCVFDILRRMWRTNWNISQEQTFF